MTENDVNTLKKTIFTKVWAKAESNRIEVTKRLVDTAARYTMECYKEVKRQLEDIMEAGQLLRLNPSINSTIFKEIEEMRVEKLEKNMNIYAEQMIDQEQPVKELVRLITTYRYMYQRVKEQRNNPRQNMGATRK